MNSAGEVLEALRQLGSEQTRKVLSGHGAPLDSLFGVKIGDLKPLQKKIRGNQQLALELYQTGNSDAMYLAGLVANGALMSKKQLKDWASQATWSLLSEHTVPGVAAESPHGPQLADQWIDSKKVKLAATGWATWSLIVATKPDDQLDLARLRVLLKRVETEIPAASDRVRYCMNGFVISVGGYVVPLLETAREVARRLGKVSVDVGQTSCKVPVALDYIGKMEARGVIGRKRSSTKC